MECGIDENENCSSAKYTSVFFSGSVRNTYVFRWGSTVVSFVRPPLLHLTTRCVLLTIVIVLEDYTMITMLNLPIQLTPVWCIALSY